MAQLLPHWSFIVMANLGPGDERGHWANYGGLDEYPVINVTAHPLLFLDPTTTSPMYPDAPSELMVKDVRSHINELGGRTILFEIRNTGPKLVRSYRVNISRVVP